MKDLRAVKQYQKILVDGANLAARSFHGIKLSYEGKPTGMLYGVVRFVMAMHRAHPGAEVVFLWEGGNNRRKELWPEYKANRGDRSDGTFSKCLDEVKRAVAWMGCTQVHHAGLEADDVAYWYVMTSVVDVNILLVSTDEDWFQMLGEHVDIMRHDRVETAEDIEKLLGYPPHKIGLMKILTGDNSDNIPGVPGMRKAVAIELVKLCSSYDEFMDIDLSGLNKSWEKYEHAIVDHWSVISRNAQIILFHSDWIDLRRLVSVPGVVDGHRLWELVTDNGMDKLALRLEEAGYVTRQA